MPTTRKMLSAIVVLFCMLAVSPRAIAAQAGAGSHAQHMMAATPLDIPMNRMGSGTTWIPDALSLPSSMKMLGSWELMLHGFAFLQYNRQDGPRGDHQFGSLNWGMLMLSRNILGGRMQFRTMLSLDPATVTERGYPLLLQSGEVHDGEAIHDRQHPHDFWMELALLYERELSSNIGFSLYAAPAGEPALSPVAFMHRPSAMDDPVAPLGHHSMDATHITYGVFTGGLFTRTLKIEGSIFNGREPDDERWNIETGKLDSWSARVTINPDSQWSVSAGYGELQSPTALAPQSATKRISAGILHGRKTVAGQWATSLVVGANKHDEHPRWMGSALLESELVLDRSNTFTMRLEMARKGAEELALLTGPNPLDHHDTVDLQSLSVGYIRELFSLAGLSTGIGGRGTINFVPAKIEAYYGSRTPLGFLVFTRVRPVGSR